MSLHINRFIEKIKAAESRGMRDITMTTAEARDLHNELTRILLKIESMTDAAQASDTQVLTLEVKGEPF